MIQLIPAGRTFKVFGLQGALWLQIEKPFLPFIKKHKVVFFNVEGNDVPFFIERMKEEENFLVKFKDINNPEDAASISNQTFYVDQSRIKKPVVESTKDDELSDWVGYKLFDETSGITGCIKVIEEFPQQLMATVSYDDKECYVLLREEWILQIDDTNKTIQMRLPEGMFE